MPTTTAPPERPVVLSPAQRAETARKGLRYSGIAALGGLVALLVMAPYAGVALGIWSIKKAREHGNPARLGVVVLTLNVVATVAMVLVALRLLSAV